MLAATISGLLSPSMSLAEGTLKAALARISSQSRSPSMFQTLTPPPWVMMMNHGYTRLSTSATCDEAKSLPRLLRDETTQISRPARHSHANVSPMRE